MGGLHYDTRPELQSSAMAGNYGSLSNSHSGINNLRFAPPIFDPILDRRSDPGAGAFSDYIDFGFQSDEPVAGGDELFVSYGENW